MKGDLVSGLKLKISCSNNIPNKILYQTLQPKVPLPTQI